MEEQSNVVIHKKQLGLWSCMSLVMGNMIGAGIFLLPASLAAFGSISLLGWVVSTCGALALALVFSKLSRLLPKMGGPYTYCHAALGDFMGFEIAFCYWVASLSSVAALLVALVAYLSVLFPTLANNNVASFFVAMTCLWMIAAINVSGIKKMRISQMTMTILKCLPLLLIAFVGVFYIDAENLKVFNMSGRSNVSAISAAGVLTAWALMGLESATIPSEHVVNPRRTIPLATLLGTLLTAILYILCSVVIMGMIAPETLQHSLAPFADVSQIMFGKWTAEIIAGIAVISCFSCSIGWVLLQGEMPLAAAKDKLFPPIFSKVSRRNVPVNGFIISAIIVSIIIIANYQRQLVDEFTLLVDYSALAYLIMFLFTGLSALILFIKNHFSSPKLLFYCLAAVISCAYALWMLLGSANELVFFVVFLLITSVPIYVWTKWLYRR